MIDQEYEKFKMDLKNVKLSMWKEMQDSLEMWSYVYKRRSLSKGHKFN